MTASVCIFFCLDRVGVVVEWQRNEETDGTLPKLGQTNYTLTKLGRKYESCNVTIPAIMSQ